MSPSGAIVIDTSALIAILLNEDEQALYLARLKQSSRCLISSVSVVETRMVALGRLGPRGVALIDDLLRLPSFEIAAPGKAEAEIAYSAFLLYGKGSGHPAGLNLGDVFSYALAKTRNLPLLFKGNDFSQTDIPSAL